MSNLKNVNLDVAQFAMKCVKNVIKDKKSNDKKADSEFVDKGKYKTLVKKMPTLIQKNGFIGTLVFNLSKTDKNYHKETLINIIEWNIENDKINNIKNIRERISSKYDDKTITEYVEWVTSLEPREYRLITKEMMNLFGWIKRFADGMIEGEE